MTIAAGSRLGPYEVLSPLGAGGMGEVYRARDTKLEREVALKVLAPELLADEGARKRFRREALALARLNHPHIAQVYDFANEKGVDFLVMELIPGEALSERTALGPLPERDVLKYGRELATGLAAAHAQGIIHCDLKPANLRLTREGDLKILDFGLARLKRPSTDDDATVSMASTDFGVSGTFPYMAPEQLRAERLDARTDLWAAGVVLYELATGTRPFRDNVPTRLADAILHSDPDRPTARWPEISPGLEQVVLRCLEKNADLRYQTAGDLLSDLRRLEAGSAPGSAPPFPLPPARSSRRLHLAATAAALLTIALAAILARRWIFSDRISTAGAPKPGAAPAAALQAIAVLPLANMTGDPGQEYFADGMTEALITELAKIRSLKVISRTSVMRFKKSDKPLPEIAKQLGVEGVVEGSVARGSGRVKVTAQLIQAASDAHLWADSFERPEADILALQSEVARAIAGQVRATISPEEAIRLNPRRKVKPEAYDLVLQGTHLYKSGGGPDAFHRSIGLFEKAIAIDPGSVEAHAGLASSLQILAGYGFASYWDVFPRIRKEVDTAIALDPTYSWVHLAKGDLLWAERDPQGALASYKRAIDLDPGNSSALSSYGDTLALFEPRGEGERLMRRAIEIDPLAQLPRCNYKDRLYGERRFAEAEAQARKILDFDPDWFWALDQLWRIHVREGKLVEAQKESRRAWTVAFGDAFKPPANASWKDYESWLDRFLEGQSRSWVPGFLAANYARRGEKQKALDYLEKAATGNDVFMWLLDWPDFDSIRGDSRFEKIVDDRKLPVAGFCRIPGDGKR